MNTQKKDRPLDRRSRYSLNMIQEAFVSLLKDKELSAITVTDICRRADLNRGTFYKYYKDVPDLYEQMTKDFIRSIDGILQGMDITAENALAEMFSQVFETLLENREFLYHTHADGYSHQIAERILGSMRHQITGFIHQLHPDISDEDMPHYITYTIGGCSYFINSWLSDPQEPVDTMVDRILKFL